MNFSKRKWTSLKGKIAKKNPMSSSTVISIPNGHGVAPQERKPRFSFPSISSFLREKGQYDSIKLIHSIKVGISLVLVSLLYLLKPLYDQVGENAMWAIMTVVVVFEFFVGLSPSQTYSDFVSM